MRHIASEAALLIRHRAEPPLLADISSCGGHSALSTFVLSFTQLSQALIARIGEGGETGPVQTWPSVGRGRCTLRKTTKSSSGPSHSQKMLSSWPRTSSPSLRSSRMAMTLSSPPKRLGSPSPTPSPLAKRPTSPPWMARCSSALSDWREES